MSKEVEEIIRKKRSLIRGLEENIFKDFTEEEENILHSKHGIIRVKYRSPSAKVHEGMTGAFKVGLPLVIDEEPVKIIPKITIIDWESSTFQNIDGDWFSFEFTPIPLSDLFIKILL